MPGRLRPGADENARENQRTPRPSCGIELFAKHEPGHPGGKGRFQRKNQGDALGRHMPLRPHLYKKSQSRREDPGDGERSHHGRSERKGRKRGRLNERRGDQRNGHHDQLP